jgi:hypothetical protein
MTLIELQNVLGGQIELLTDSNTSYEEKKKIAETASVVSSLAKQMINNADVMLRREKLIADGKMADERMKELVG